MLNIQSTQTVLFCTFDVSKFRYIEIEFPLLLYLSRSDGTALHYNDIIVHFVRANQVKEIFVLRNRFKVNGDEE